jgi:prepilin-type N-terminal cleavage/methylation domain-containing protein
MNMRRHRTKGFSLIELLIVVTIILIIAAIAIPNLMRSKSQANETSAIESLRALNESALLYSNTYGGYPHALSDMGPAAGGAAPTSTSADLIDSVLSSGVKSGYKFTYTAAGTDPGGNVQSYAISATPLTPGASGQRSFYTDQGGTIRATASGTADATSPPIG